jgi:hypothetical protein
MADIGIQKPQVNLSPKLRFQKINGAITAHRALLENVWFDAAADAAMNELILQLSMQVRDGNGAMSVGFRMQGAQEFLSMFKTLAEQNQLPKPRSDPDNLPNLDGLKRQ